MVSDLLTLVSEIGLSKKFCGGTDQIFCIFDTGGLVRRMHGKLRQSDIDSVQCNLRVGNIAKCGSACHIGTVGKSLNRDTSGMADILEHGCRNGISTIFLIGILFNDNSLIQVRSVRWIGLFCIIRMNCVSIVSRDHETVGKMHKKILFIISKVSVDSCQCIF